MKHEITMKMYMGSTQDKEDGACLVFARSAKEAKRLAWLVISGWFMCDYTDLRIKRIKAEHLYNEADYEKLKNGISHVIESPTVCNNCECWGGEPYEDDTCEFCK